MADSRIRRVVQCVRRHANVKYILPAAVALGLIGWIASIASAPQSSSELWTVVQGTWPIVLFLTFPYLAARAFVWYRLLAQLGIHVPPRQAAVSFAGGEITKSLPAGVYVENYLLSRLVHFTPHSVIRSSMATTATLGLESLIAVPVALVVGVPHAAWLSWLLIGVVIAWLVVLTGAWLLVHFYLPSLDQPDSSLVHRVGRAADDFLTAGAELLTLDTLVQCVPTALYMFIYVIDLYAILLALGIHNVSLAGTMGMYSIMVLAVILVPIPTELGITELTGLGILLNYGVPSPRAALAMLSLRLLATGLTIVVAGVVLIVLRPELATTTNQEAICHR